MDLRGTIYTSVDVDTFYIIQKLCQEIGVVDKLGKICVHIEGNEIVEYKLDIFDKSERKVLYDQPFDVQYAMTLISLYKQTCRYLALKESEVKKSDDYQTAFKLDIRKH